MQHTKCKCNLKVFLNHFQKKCNFAKFKGKYLCQSFPQPATLFQKETLVKVFSCKFSEIAQNTFFTEHLRETASSFPQKNSIVEVG